MAQLITASTYQATPLKSSGNPGIDDEAVGVNIPLKQYIFNRAVQNKLGGSETTGKLLVTGFTGGPYTMTNNLYVKSRACSIDNINNNGKSVIVGWASVNANGSDPEPVKWHHPGTEILITNLGNLGGNNGVANSINNKGTIVGWSMNATNEKKAFIHSGMMTPLFQHDDPVESEATCINNKDQVCGWYKNNNGEIRGFIYLHSGV